MLLAGMVIESWAGPVYQITRINEVNGIEYAEGYQHLKYGKKWFRIPSVCFFNKNEKGKLFPLFDVIKE